jgi:hypothetical protein
LNESVDAVHQSSLILQPVIKAPGAFVQSDQIPTDRRNHIRSIADIIENPEDSPRHVNQIAKRLVQFEFLLIRGRARRCSDRFENSSLPG